MPSTMTGHRRRADDRSRLARASATSLLGARSATAGEAVADCPLVDEPVVNEPVVEEPVVR